MYILYSTIDGPAASYYVTEGFKTEMKISRLQLQLSGDLSAFRDYLNLLDSFTYCETAFSDAVSGKSLR